MKRLFAAALVASLALGAAAARADDASLFASKCAACHGKDGKGGSMAKSPIAGMAEADAHKAIADGKGKMPAYKGKLSDAEISGLAKYVHGLK
ncbi:c-type cytochrome [Anaeromyxobacter paludicola]|uniref:Cytochrome c domain-containing protein n=1 Tax=Anaeromyxobacter paludicola TaxID=2918171 RepID=A0ABN6NAK3_9BACT|nr:cytochrome c [Anaeromyxobacter paludicola]BDG10283.1 hypothetical protein AMPC_33960 [Anaeromyxobacter paludicola]